MVARELLQKATGEKASASRNDAQRYWLHPAQCGPCSWKHGLLRMPPHRRKRFLMPASLQAFGSEKGHEVVHAARVAPLVVIPGDDLKKVAVHHLGQLAIHN